MKGRIALVTLVVPDYDRAIAFYCGAMRFDLVQDMQLPDGRRWVVVRPNGGEGTGLLLAEAVSSEQEAAIGNQTGGRVGFFLHTDDFERDFAAFAEAGVRFLEAPRTEAYGKVAVFEDAFGNKWDLLQPSDT